ncbi:MAG: amino acid-binding protein [Deltaproteobacteria bacterium]|jgi:hypothetical protein|nr:amino acid-binding protein [Deltaproteobacteria bacterium]
METNPIVAVREIVINGKKPAKLLAQEIGKPYSTMMRELNQYDDKAKLGVETLMDIMKATGDVTPLQVMAEQLGYELSQTARQDTLPDGWGAVQPVLKGRRIYYDQEVRRA